MQRHLLITAVIALAAGSASAQMATQTTQTTRQTTAGTAPMGQATTGAATNNVGNPAIKDSTPHSMTSATRGANSFTQAQARKRLAKAGYMTSRLTKDADGVWMGSATKGGKTVNVGLDFKGNITER